MNDTDEMSVEESEFLQNEIMIEMERFARLKIKSTDAFLSTNVDKLKAVVLDLLRVCFGEDVSADNIKERLEKHIDAMEIGISEASGPPQPGVNSVAETHILFTQRILAAYIGGITKKLEGKWVDIWSESHGDFIELSAVHDVLLKYRMFLNMIPCLVTLRADRPQFLGEYDSGDFTEALLLNPEAGKATITLDLLQPKENLVAAFEKFIDQAKAKISERPESKMLVNLYDFTRKKDGRRDKPLYNDWHKAIIDFEETSDYGSFYQAAQDFAPQKKDGNQGIDTTRKNFANRTKRYYSLLYAVMNNKFPSLN